jgi:hypothetical protein
MVLAYGSHEQVAPNLNNKHVSVTNSVTRDLQARTVILSPNMLHVRKEVGLNSRTLLSCSIRDERTRLSFGFLGIYFGSATRPSHCLEER